MNIVDKALEIAIKAHKGQRDLAGVDYIEHPKSVANLVNSDEEKAVAYLHDVLEDTYITEKDLLQMGIPNNIVLAVKVLTKEKNEPYTKYIERVKENKLASTVKIADLQHNMNLSRIANPSKRDYERLEKYKRALTFLKL
jgi:(p)ppGpp synthase/HD superfamily hydrolase